MLNNYSLRYLPLFYDDLENIVFYICNVLENKPAAERLIDKIERAILKRLPIAEAFEPFRSQKVREYPYYRIYVDNYIVFYVVLEESDEKIMEVRRILYKGMDRDNII